MKLPNPFIIEACCDPSSPVASPSSAGTLEQGRPATVANSSGSKARQPRSEHENRDDDPMLRGVAVLTNSVSPGAGQGSLPPGEIEPSVMLASAPGESHTTEGGAQPPLAAVALEHETAGGLDCIHEIFYYARKLWANSSDGGGESRPAFREVGINGLTRMEVDSSEAAQRLTAVVARGPSEAFPRGFDPLAFFEAIEPPPIFLQRAQ